MNPHLPTISSQLVSDLSDAVNRKVLRRLYNRPWMKSKELDIILEIIRNSNPRNCLEWGSGSSTLFFPQHVPGLQSWISIEHHPEWFQFVSRKLSDPGVTLRLIESEDPVFTTTKHSAREKREGRYEDFKSYVELKGISRKSFDFIFIDGRARKECLKRSYDLISDLGTVIVHDANRDYYFDNLPPFASTLRLTDYRKRRNDGGIWIGRKNREVSEVLNVEHHSRLWRQHDLAARVFLLR